MKLPTYNQVLATFALVIAGFAIWTFADRLRPDPVVGAAAALPAAKEVKTVERVIERPKLVYVYPEKVKADLGLPHEVAKNPDRKVTATGKLNAEERPYTLTAVLDTQTGESEVYARPDPLPWVGPGTQAALGIGYGYKGGEPMGWVHGRYDLLRMKAVHGGVSGVLYQDGEHAVGGYIELRF